MSYKILRQWKLYNLSKDRSEAANLIYERPDIAEMMKVELSQLLKSATTDPNKKSDIDLSKKK